MPSAPTTYSGLVSGIVDIVNYIVAALFAVVFVYLIWKIIDSWIINAGDETKRADGRKYATAAVIVFVIMVSVWGIVNMLKTSIFG